MIVVGDISGIQNYLFDVAAAGGGQAQRLRARSFYVQLLAEAAALRVLRALKWPLVSIQLSGAGKFVLEGAGPPNVDDLLLQERHDVNEWLLRETRAELRLTLAWDNGESTVESYSQAQRQLQALKLRPWAPREAWDSSRLVLAPLDTPCGLCGHAPASQEERDRDTGETRRVCRTCAKNREIGRRLPGARWLVIRETPEAATFELLGLGIDVANTEQPTIAPQTLAVANLRDPEARPTWCPEAKFLNRRLMAHVPVDAQGAPVFFSELASRSHGDHLLGVLKADADSLGACFANLLETAGLAGMSALSERLDRFFAGRLRRELASGRDGFGSIYTIFSGGDDLVMVGPWDTMLGFAGQLCRWFGEDFRERELTLSAGLALVKPTRPIKAAVAEAERLLEQAKDSGKDRLAALGQIWPWRDHAQILDSARMLVEWVERKQMERGWLHTLLNLAEARHRPTPDLMATAHLAYHVFRNYKEVGPRKWATSLVDRFDDLENVDVRYLPAIVRFALTATRSPE